jgi:hypothetical protein
LNCILAQQGPKFFLKSLLPMVFLLIGDVSFQLLDAGLPYGERAVTTLPVKPLVFGSLCLDPLRRTRLYFPTQAKKHVDMVFGPVNGQGGRIRGAKDGCQVWMQFGLDFRPDEGLTVLGAEN